MTEFEEDVREEVLALFPEIDPDSYEGYGPSARPALKAFEARALGAGPERDGLGRDLAGRHGTAAGRFRPIEARDAPLDALTLCWRSRCPAAAACPLRLWQGAADGTGRSRSTSCRTARCACCMAIRWMSRRSRVPRARAGARVAHGALCGGRNDVIDALNADTGERFRVRPRAGVPPGLRMRFPRRRVSPRWPVLRPSPPMPWHNRSAGVGNRGAGGHAGRPGRRSNGSGPE
jgi:hypothetical protein